MTTDPTPNPPGPAPAAPQKPDIIEKDIWSGSPSLKVAVYPAIILALIVVVAEILFWSTKGSQWLVWRLAVYLVAFAALFVRYYFKQAFVVYRLTNKYLYCESGVLNKTVEQVDLRRCRDLTVLKALMNRIVGCGTISILSTDLSNPDMIVRDIAAPDEVASRIRDAVDARRTTIIDVE